jgi:ABC-type Fe3+-siderophore transport system permease subunit
MAIFRAFLVLVTVGILGYTGVVGANHGWNLVPIFFGEMSAMTWSGQFNFDFMCFLVLSGIWTSWRSGFTPKGLALGTVAISFGIMFLAPYLLYLSYKEGGDTIAMIVGSGNA